MKKRNRKTIAGLVSFVLAAAVAAAAAVWLEDRFLGSATSAGRKTAAEYLNEMNTVYFGGEAYLPKKGISTLLVIGLDALGRRADSGSYNNSAQADLILLFVFDNKQKTYTALQLDRDTMTDMDMLGLGGKKSGTRYAQLALAHTYGNGLEESGENTVRAVSNLLFGTRIDGYVSLTMDAVKTVNDRIGGVTVALEEDYTELDAGYTKGSVIRLEGDRALEFVRARSSMNDPSNSARMKRQKLYLRALFQELSKTEMTDDDYAQMYDTLSPYMVTNCDANMVSGALEALLSYTCADIVSPEGEEVAGDEYMEFYADDEKLKDFIVKLFYTKLES